MEIAELRVEINNIDNEIVKLLVQRMEVATNIGLEKKKKGLPVFDAVRERERLNTISGMVENDVLKPHMENIYRCIMDETKLVEEKLMEV